MGMGARCSNCGEYHDNYQQQATPGVYRCGLCGHDVQLYVHPDMTGAVEARDIGEGQAAQATDPDWVMRATKVAMELSYSQKEWSPSAVWEHIEPPLNRQGKVEKRALAGVMRRLQKEGVIRSTGRVQKCPLRSRHTGYENVWESLVYKGDDD